MFLWRLALAAGLWAGGAAQTSFSFGLSLSSETSYIVQLSVYYFSRAQWISKFAAGTCPEFSITPVRPPPGCPLSSTGPFRPLKSLRRCDLAPALPDCVAYRAAVASQSATQNCALYPNMCLPPVWCDLSPNNAGALCLGVNLTDCSSGTDVCKTQSKCDIPAYASLASCQAGNDCRNDPTLCLSRCDISTQGYADECMLEACALTPSAAGCAALANCATDSTCSGMDFINKDECCPDVICRPDCVLTNNCRNITITPTDSCELAHQLGFSLLDIFTTIVNTSMITDLVKCYTSINTNTTQTSEMGCFAAGVTEALSSI